MLQRVVHCFHFFSEKLETSLSISNEKILTIDAYTQTTVCVRINSGQNDAEEEALAGGAVETNSLDLDMGQSNTESVGLRYDNLNIPQGASVTSAYIQFAADEVNTQVSNLTIKGEAADNAAPFITNGYNLSSRSTTSASVGWSPPAWNVIGESGSAQKTPDISAVINEIVNRPGYVQGNALALFVTGTGKRTSIPYDFNASQAPELCITYTGCTSGATCNDNDDCTINDIYDNNCNCIGTPLPDSNNDGICDYFVELYNNDTAPIDLTGWHLTDGISYSFPAGTIMNPGDYLVICADPTVCQSEFGISGALGPYSGGLSGGGDDIILRDNFFKIHDKVDYAIRCCDGYLLR